MLRFGFFLLLFGGVFLWLLWVLRVGVGVFVLAGAVGFCGFLCRFVSSFRYSFCIFPVYLRVPYAFNDICRLIIKIKLNKDLFNLCHFLYVDI